MSKRARPCTEPHVTEKQVQHDHLHIFAPIPLPWSQLGPLTFGVLETPLPMFVM